MGIVDGGAGYPLERQEFGIESVSAISRSTGLPYGMAAIVGDGSVALEASSVDNRGGSSLYARATEITEVDSNATFNLKSYPDWIFPVFFGATVANVAASAANGTITALTNEVGTSVFSATTGITTATLTTGKEADLKSGWYMVIGVTATTVDVYRASTFQSTRGADLFLDSDTLKITTTPLTVTASSAVVLPGTGIDLTGGSGTIALTVGDVAFFQVTTPHNGISNITLGAYGVTFPEHELIIVGKQRGSGETAMIRCYKAQAVSGGTINFSQSDFSSTDITVKLLYDATKGGIGLLTYGAEIV